MMGTIIEKSSAENFNHSTTNFIDSYPASYLFINCGITV